VCVVEAFGCNGFPEYLVFTSKKIWPGIEIMVSRVFTHVMSQRMLYIEFELTKKYFFACDVYSDGSFQT
jgi:hypothetical protein